MNINAQTTNNPHFNGVWKISENNEVTSNVYKAAKKAIADLNSQKDLNLLADSWENSGVYLACSNTDDAKVGSKLKELIGSITDVSLKYFDKDFSGDFFVKGQEV